jgi:hypothetical protein
MVHLYPGTRDEDWYTKFGLRYNITNMEMDILIGASCHVMLHDF